MSFRLPQNKKICFSPLYWGMGHTTRLIPIIEKAIEKNNEIYIACNQIQKFFLAHRFQKTNIHFLPLEGYNIEYSSISAFTPFKILAQIPKINKYKKDENKKLKEWYKAYNFDYIISDSRLGFYHTQCKNIFITHQIYPKSGFGKAVDNIAAWVLQKTWEKYDEIWIPDVENKRLAGALSAINPKYKSKMHYIGWLSHLQVVLAPNEFKYLFILSGPEPQKSMFETQAKKFITLLNEPCMIVGANIESENSKKMADAPTLSHLIAASEIIVCRSGYSTLMDLMQFQNKTIQILPTPGQAEQVYLYNYNIKNGFLPFGK